MKKNKFIIVTVVFILQVTNFQLNAQDTNALYPVGNRFPLGLYSFEIGDTLAPADGWNAAHNYQEAPTSDSTLNTYKHLGMMGFARLSYIKDSSYYSVDHSIHKIGKSETIIASEIRQQTANGNICWFDIPEECRWWISSEMDIVKNYTSWTQKYDTAKRPNYMYLPGHYSSSNIEKYVGYLDIIPASCYPNYMGLPNSYVRYQIESTFSAIAAQKKIVGKNYLNGEKTVIAILELFDGSGMNAVESRHDFWLALASGVKGINVYSYYYRDSSATLKSCWAALTLSAKQFTSAKLDKPLLFGTSYTFGMTIKSGPSKTTPFTPPDSSVTSVSYSSISVIAKTYADTLYMIAVNSNGSTIPVTVEFSGLPVTFFKHGTVLFENRIVSLSNNKFTDSFNPLEVHVYKFAMQSATQVDKLIAAKTEFNIYPNPLNPTATISFELPEAGNVNLVVYDYLGREVSTLVNEYKSIGHYRFTFNANNLASGVYFCRLKAGNFTSIRKMILVK